MEDNPNFFVNGETTSNFFFMENTLNYFGTYKLSLDNKLVKDDNLYILYFILYEDDLNNLIN